MRTIQLLRIITTMMFSMFITTAFSQTLNINLNSQQFKSISFECNNFDKWELDCYDFISVNNNGNNIQINIGEDTSLVSNFIDATNSNLNQLITTNKSYSTYPQFVTWFNGTLKIQSYDPTIGIGGFIYQDLNIAILKPTSKLYVWLLSSNDNNFMRTDSNKNVQVAVINNGNDATQLYFSAHDNNQITITN